MSRLHQRMVRRFCLLGGWSLLSFSGLAQDLKAPVPGREPWSVKVYPFPGNVWVYETEEGGEARPVVPLMPAEDAPPEEVILFLRKNHDAVASRFRGAGMPLPPGSLAAVDAERQALVIRTTKDMHDDIQRLSDDYVATLPKVLSFSLCILEADEKLVRKLVEECAAVADHQPALVRLEGLVGQGDVVEVTRLRLETRSGQPANLSTGSDFLYTQGVERDQRGRISAVQGERRVGTSFELDPVLWPDGRTIDISYVLEYHHAPPRLRWESMGQSDGRSVEVQVPEFFTAKVSSAFAMVSGSAKLLGLWKPEQVVVEPSGDRLQIAFLRAEAVPVRTAIDPQLEKLLLAHGAKVEPMPQGPPPKDPHSIPGMVTKSWRVPPDFLSIDSPNPPDPFAPSSERKKPPLLQTAKKLLESQGIPFPQGATARFLPATERLIVRNTPANVELVGQFLSPICGGRVPSSLNLTLHVVQADGATLRKLAADAMPLANHEALWKSLETEVEAGRAKVMRSAWLESRSGNRVGFTAGVEHLDLENSQVTAAGTSAPQPGRAPASRRLFESRPVGLRVECDPVIGPDGRTIDLSLGFEHAFAPLTRHLEAGAPDNGALRSDAAHSESQQVSINMPINMLTGHTKLIGIWKPEGAPGIDAGADIMQVAFLRVVYVVQMDERFPPP